MPARTTRKDARDRIVKTFLESLNRIIPEDESRPMKGSVFADWENQADELRRAVIPTLLEERAALETNAQVVTGGHCPLCGSDSVYLEKQTTSPEVMSPDGPVVIEKQHCRCRTCGGSFSPQNRDWALPSEANLTPHAAERMNREAAQKSFDETAKSLGIDWKVDWDGKQIQRWVEALADTLVRDRDAEILAYQQGCRPASGPDEPALLVIGVDGGRYQGQEKDPETQSRWKEDKVCTVSSYVPGDGTDKAPQKLVTTHVATSRDAKAFGPMARLEAERRGLRSATMVTLMGDCANWIDPLHEEHFPFHPRIADYDHAVEHLWEASRAALGTDCPKVPGLAKHLETWLYNGEVKKVIRRLTAEAAKKGVVQEGDGQEHPRRILAKAIGYFERNQPHMNYPAYRAQGWPIGSGNTEAGVKQFNKRVKGTDQRWSDRGIEALLCLRAQWISQDSRWQRYWADRPAYRAAA